MAAEFEDIYKWMRKQPWWIQSKFFFVNPKASMGKGYYNQSYLERIWKEAAAKCGETINLYRGLVSSSITRLSELGYSDSQIGLASGKSPDTVRSHYKAATMAAKRNVLDRKVIQMGEVKHERK